jgi:hypothetical protein
MPEGDIAMPQYMAEMSMSCRLMVMNLPAGQLAMVE